MELEKAWEALMGQKPKKPDSRSEFAPQIAHIIFDKANDTKQNIWMNGINFLDVKIFAQENGTTLDITCTIKKGESEEHFNGAEQELAQKIEGILDRDIKCILSTPDQRTFSRSK